MEETEAPAIAEIRVKARVTTKSITGAKRRDIKCDAKSIKDNMSSVSTTSKRKRIHNHCNAKICNGKRIDASNWSRHIANH